MGIIINHYKDPYYPSSIYLPSHFIDSWLLTVQFVYFESRPWDMEKLEGLTNSKRLAKAEKIAVRNTSEVVDFFLGSEKFGPPMGFQVKNPIRCNSFQVPGEIGHEHNFIGKCGDHVGLAEIDLIYFLTHVLHVFLKCLLMSQDLQTLCFIFKRIILCLSVLYHNVLCFIVFGHVLFYFKLHCHIALFFGISYY